MVCAHRSRPLFVALGLAAMLLPSCGGSSGPIDGGKAMAHVRAMVGFADRGAEVFEFPRGGAATDDDVFAALLCADRSFKAEREKKTQRQNGGSGEGVRSHEGRGSGDFL